VGVKFVRVGNVGVGWHCVGVACRRGAMMNRVNDDFMRQPNLVIDGIRNVRNFPDCQIIQTGIRIDAKGDFCVAGQREGGDGSGSL